MSQENNNSIIAKVNNVPIILIEREKLVPIKPICEALEIDYSGQIQKMKDDDILSSTTVLSNVVAADGKEREKTCLSLKYVSAGSFLLTIKI